VATIANPAPRVRNLPVEERPPLPALIVLGIQHVLVMYAGNVAVPLLVANALKLPTAQTAFLINADLFAAGIATLVQTIGIWKFGARLPVMMGATFLSVAPMIALSNDPSIGLTGFYGALIVSGAIGILIAPLIGVLLPLFPALVTGSVITLLGVSLLSVAIGWAGGGESGSSLGLAFFVFVTVAVLTKLGRGIWKSLAVMIGLIIGTLAAAPLGLVRLNGFNEARWIAIVPPFQFGAPTWNTGAVLTLTLVMIIILIESTGVFFAISEITAQSFPRDRLVRALRGDGLGVLAGGVFNAFAYTSYSQNVGLVSITSVRSRYVCAAGGVFLIFLAMFPKLAHVVAAIPGPVLGGAGIVMFGMVAATGIRVLGQVDFHSNPGNLFIVASSLGFGMIPVLAPEFFRLVPKWASPITGNGVVLGAVTAVVLNYFFNGWRRPEGELS
jgi:uric acid transporter